MQLRPRQRRETLPLGAFSIVFLFVLMYILPASMAQHFSPSAKAASIGLFPSI